MFGKIRTLSLFTLFCLNVSAIQAQKGGNEEVSKPVKNVVQSIRNSKDDAALKYFDTEAQGRYLFGDDWTKASAAQKKEFTQLFQSIFAKTVFPKVRENFKNLETIIYENPVVSGNEATVNSTIIFNHPLKKQEIKCTYKLLKQQDWKLVDVAQFGNYMLSGVRDEQIQPLMKQGGWNQLLTTMRQKNAELSKK